MRHRPGRAEQHAALELNTVSPLPEGAQSAGDSCWVWSEDYTCAATALSDDCQELIGRGCTQVGSDCVDRLTSGACDLNERTYSCQTSLAVQTQRTVCDQAAFCQGGGCFDTSHPANQGFRQGHGHAGPDSPPQSSNGLTSRGSTWASSSRKSRPACAYPLRRRSGRGSGAPSSSASIVTTTGDD
ncbi:MAG: hypothetical protein DVS81_15045 [Candidatus Accumulibacter meliphilus]|uniref:IncF plasmid conjugative transfer protein TraN n=1 Tax=Candidatus Accumulibacter meliphilus TaxID=2211374 RepID=A0A369XMU2_9PROT|nr:MAG: hypothetical protein DVS81_15045 [Candidatus Accumulibacter meliphilus]